MKVVSPDAGVEDLFSFLPDPTAVFNTVQAVKTQRQIVPQRVCVVKNK